MCSSDLTKFIKFGAHLLPQLNQLLNVLFIKQKIQRGKDLKEKEKKSPGACVQTLVVFSVATAPWLLRSIPHRLASLPRTRRARIRRPPLLAELLLSPSLLLSPRGLVLPLFFRAHRNPRSPPPSHCRRYTSPPSNRLGRKLRLDLIFVLTKLSFLGSRQPAGIVVSLHHHRRVTDRTSSTFSSSSRLPRPHRTPQ